MENKNINTNGLYKLKMLITVVNRQKADFYTDVLSQYDVNLTLSTRAIGTAKTEVLNLLGIDESEKTVLISFIKEEMTGEILSVLEEKFATIKNGKGIAFTIPLSSIISTNAYRFLSNSR